MAEDESWALPAVVRRWQESWGRLPAPVHRELAERMVFAPGVRLLDLACGSGELAAAALRSGCVVTGVDTSRPMLEAARASAPDARFVEADLGALPFPDGSFDVVTAVNAVQFAADADDAVAEARRVLRAGGLLALSGWGPRADQDAARVGGAVEAGEAAEPGGDAAEPGVDAVDPLAELLEDGGLDLVSAATVRAPLLLTGEPALLAAFAPDADERERAQILTAAAPFRQADGSYLLQNTFRCVIARKP